MIQEQIERERFIMKIDARKLKEVYLPKAKKIANDERFYSVPDADGYSLSDYGRLLYGSKWVPVVYVSGEGIYCEYYNSNFPHQKSAESAQYRAKTAIQCHAA